jgi:hypothetical protein
MEIDMMKLVTAAAVAAFAMATAPALAQSSGNQSGSGSAAKATPGQAGNPHAMTQDKLRQTLQQAGFQNVTVLDAAYLVQAKSKDGDTVLMMINPPASVTGSIAPGAQGGKMSGQGGSAQSGDDSSSSNQQ